MAPLSNCENWMKRILSPVVSKAQASNWFKVSKTRRGPELYEAARLRAILHAQCFRLTAEATHGRRSPSPLRTA